MKLLNNATKKSKILVIISTIVSAILAATLITSVCLLPNDSSFTSEDGAFTSIYSLGEGNWLYTTNKNVFLIGDDESVIAKSNVVDVLNEEIDDNCGSLSYAYARQGGKNIYVATKTSSGGYVVKLDETLKVLDYVGYNGSLKRMLESDDGKDFYLFAGVDTGEEIRRYNADELSEDYLFKGYVYTILGGKETYRLTYARDFKIVNATVLGDKLYIVHSNGIIVMSADFEMNSFKHKIEDETERIFKELKAEQGEDADETELKKTAASLAKENLGVVSESGNITEVKKDNFDLNKYCTFIADTLTFRGGLYRAEDNSFYLTAADTSFYRVGTDEIVPKRINGIIAHGIVEGITLPLIPEGTNTSLFYDRSDESVLISYENSDKVSKINLKEKKLEYTVTADFGIRSLFQSKDGSKLFYFFYNKNRGSDVLLYKGNVFGKTQEPTLKTLAIISAVALVVSAVTCVISWIYAVSKKNRVKLIKLGKDMAKAKWIYLVLLVPVVLLLLFCYYETVASIVLSFFDYTTSSPTQNWNNFKNYIDIFSNSETLKSFLNMFYFLVFDLFASIVPPIIFAFFLMTMKNRRYSAFTRTMLFIPGVIPGIAGLLIWSTGILGQHGILTAIVELFNGTPQYWLANKNTARWALVLMGFPYVGGYLIFYGAMMNIPQSYHEAAELEGIGIFQRLFKIDVPLIMPQIKYTFVMMFIHSVQNFARTYTTVGDGQSITTGVITPVHYMYRNVVAGNYGVASAYATIIFVFLFAATLFNFRKKKEDLGGE